MPEGKVAKGQRKQAKPTIAVVISFLQSACARGTRRRRLHLYGACDSGALMPKYPRLALRWESESCSSWSPAPPRRAATVTITVTACQ